MIAFALTVTACTNTSAGISLKAYRDLMKEAEAATLVKTCMQGVMEGLRVRDAPRPNEILLGLVMGAGVRGHSRLGGLIKNKIAVHDGQR